MKLEMTAEQRSEDMALAAEIKSKTSRKVAELEAMSMSVDCLF